MNATMIKPPIKQNQQRSYKRSLNLHISLLIVSVWAIISRAIIPLAEEEVASPDELFKTFLMLAVAAGVSVIIELLYSLTEGTSDEFRNYSRLIDPINTGLLIALLLPTSITIYQLVLAVFVGVYIGKLVFGGYGYYIFHPALVGVLFVQIAFGSNPDGTGYIDMIFTPLMQVKQVLTEAVTIDNFSLSEFLIGNYEAVAIGSTSILLLVSMLAYLIVTKVIDWRISLTFFATVFVMSLIIGYINFEAGTVVYTAVNVMTGLVMFGTVFLVPDSVTSPTSREAKLIYATLVGVMTMLVRTVGTNFEGVVFAVLLGNMITPFLNRTVTRSNKSFLLKTSISIILFVLVLSVFLGFMVQGQMKEAFDAAIQFIGGAF